MLTQCAALWAVLFALGLIHTAGLPRDPWMDAALSVDSRVELLLAQMTNREKNAQLSYGTRTLPGGSTNATAVIEAALQRGGIGGIGCELPAAECADFLATIQTALKQKSRLGIPAMMMCETTHSGGLNGTTIFPMPAVVGSSWDTGLAQQVARQKALEARAGGCSQALSPVVQVSVPPCLVPPCSPLQYHLAHLTPPPRVVPARLVPARSPLQYHLA